MASFAISLQVERAKGVITREDVVFHNSFLILSYSFGMIRISIARRGF